MNVKEDRRRGMTCKVSLSALYKNNLDRLIVDSRLFLIHEIPNLGWEQCDAPSLDREPK